MKFFYRTFDPNFSLLKKDSESLVEDDQQTHKIVIVIYNLRQASFKLLGTRVCGSSL